MCQQLECSHLLWLQSRLFQCYWHADKANLSPKRARQVPSHLVNTTPCCCSKHVGRGTQAAGLPGHCSSDREVPNFPIQNRTVGRCSQHSANSCLKAELKAPSLAVLVSKSSSSYTEKTCPTTAVLCPGPSHRALGHAGHEQTW